MDHTKGKQSKKRQYSRDGCKECKRRKLKCDEGKPECWQCSHLGKSCVYVKSIKFSDTRNFVPPPISGVSSSLKENVTVLPAGSPITQAKLQHNKNPTKRSPLDTSVFFNVIDFSNTPNPTASKKHLQHASVDQENDTISVISNNHRALTEPMTHISPPEERRLNIINEATTLAQDIIGSIHPDLDDFLIDLTGSAYVKKHDVLDSFNLLEPHKAHLELFYDKISAWLMPLEQQLCNEILLLHARSSPYLLAAMLSLAAKDEEKSRYIATCLKNLSTVFQDTSKILSNIEPLILTILLLGSDSSSGNWRAHLRGAKDLFMKYIRFYNTTPSLLLAKSWFAAIEILAGLRSVGTGKAHELDQLLDVGLYGANSTQGVEVGLLLSNGYNVFLGYSTEAIVMYREFIKLRAMSEITNKDILFLMSLIHSAKEFQVISVDVKIERENHAHPEFQSSDEDSDDAKAIFPWSCYGFVNDEVFSWFDLIHQLHVDALLLQVHNEFYGLDRTHILCQSLVFEMLEKCFIFNDSGKIVDGSDSRLLMLQGPMLSCGMNCIEEEHKTIITGYFECLINGGVQSAKTSFKRVQSCWEGTGVDDVEVMPLNIYSLFQLFLITLKYYEKGYLS